MNTTGAIQRYAELALSGVARPFPYHLGTVFRQNQGIQRPSDVHPVFYGCFDWHSAVHGHWLLAHAASRSEDAGFSNRCVEALQGSFADQALGVEVDFLTLNPSFERPYGLAWVLMLGLELDRSSHPAIREMADSLLPLVEIAARNILRWLPKLSHPVRTGTHNQTAFSMKLALDWARHFNRNDAVQLIERCSRTLHGQDRNLPLHLEPSGEDFFSASFSGGWLMASVLTEDEFVVWYETAFPCADLIRDLKPVIPSDRSDGRLVHLDGLSLSRAWMLMAIARKLPADHPASSELMAASRRHAAVGLPAALSGEYMASHWLGTFAAYLLMEADESLDWPELI